MRFLKVWWWRMAVAAGVILLGASLTHLVSHRPFADDLVEGVGIIGGVLLMQYLFRNPGAPKQPRPQVTAEPQALKTEEHNASGG
jgi:hypothetical protein